MVTKFMLYIFKDENGCPFYAGFTKNFRRRKTAHLREIRLMNPLPKYNKARKVMRLFGKTLDDIMVPIEDGIRPEDIDNKEIELIKSLRDNGYKLYNLTDGGSGGRAVWTVPGLAERMSAIRTGKKHSLETRKRISEAHTGRKLSDEHRHSISIARRKRKITMETRIKCSLTSRGKINIKKYQLIDPQGNIYTTTEGLSKFCEDHGLTSANIVKVCDGIRKNHKGWTATRLPS
jgi:hypothetical protein